MITYKDIYDAAKRERYSDTLQPIPKSFVKDVARYLKEKRESASKENSILSDVLMKTKKQLENAATLFQELLRRRRKKILNLVLIASETGISKQDFNNMLSIEKDLFENLVESIEVSDKQLIGFLNGAKKEEENKNEAIVFLEDIEEFMGLSGEKMGPFSAGQVVNIDKNVANILLKDNKAEKI